MRLAGSLLIAAAACGFGILLSLRLSLRVRKLQAAVRYIESIAERMRLGYELPQILSSLKSEVYIKDGRWQGLDGLERREVNTLNSFLSALGSTDLLGQQHNASAHLASLREYLDEAKQQQRERQKLYLSLGVLGGLFLAVLLI